MNELGYLCCKGSSASLGLLSWLIGAVESKPAKATCFLPDYCADLPPWRKPCFCTQGEAEEQSEVGAGGR